MIGSSKRFTLLPTIVLGILPCTMVANVIRDIVALVVPWWSALRSMILLMTSVPILNFPPLLLRTSSFSLTRLSAIPVGKLHTCKEKASLAQNQTWRQAISTKHSLTMTTAARCTVAMALWLVKTVLVVVSVITQAAHANASADRKSVV